MNTMMMRAATLAVVALLASACAELARQTQESPAAAAVEKLDVQRDYHSYANTRDFRTQHLLLDLDVDFTRRVLAGSVELRLQRLSAEATELVLDTRDLDIAEVATATGQGAWIPTTFKLDDRDAILGSALRIATPRGPRRRACSG
jgi:leukotriene-A4 hydrolase